MDDRRGVGILDVVEREFKAYKPRYDGGRLMIEVGNDLDFVSLDTNDKQVSVAHVARDSKKVVSRAAIGRDEKDAVWRAIDEVRSMLYHIEKSK